MNLLLTTTDRPENSLYKFTGGNKKWGKYMSYNFVNGLLFIISFFIETLNDRGVSYNKRLLALTVLNINELTLLKNAIINQGNFHRFTVEKKYFFLQLLDEQRHDMYCLLSNYELYVYKLSESDSEANLKHLENYKHVKAFRHELNSMMEIGRCN